MSLYVFPGHKSFSDRAVSDLGLKAQTLTRRPPEALASLAHLCAQSSVAEIMLQAATLRDQLVAAGHAADLMIAEVTAARAPALPASHP
jgi:hypothetical protein